MWDLALTQYPKHNTNTGPGPIRTIQLHDHLEPYLASLYESDAIFDKFGMDVSPDGTKVVTGSYRYVVSIVIIIDIVTVCIYIYIPSIYITSINYIPPLSISNLTLLYISIYLSIYTYIYLSIIYCSNQFNIFDNTNGNTVHSCEVGTNSSTINRRSSSSHAGDTGTGSGAGSGMSRSKSQLTPQKYNNIDITKKVMNVSWCPDGKMVAVAGNAGLYIYKV